MNGIEPPNADVRRNEQLRAIFIATGPLCLAIAPIVHLYSQNLNEADSSTALIFGGGAVLAMAICLGALRLWQRNLAKAALIASLCGILFYSYGRGFDVLMQHEPLKLSYDAWHFVLIVFVVATVVTTGVVLRHSQRNFRSLAYFLSGTSLIFVLICGGAIVQHHGRLMVARNRQSRTARNPDATVANHPVLSMDSTETPDVYYIILDGYARADTLARVCQFDNSEFLDFLRGAVFTLLASRARIIR